MDIENKDGSITTHNGVYPINCFSWFLDTYAFNKKVYKTKEDAIKKFNEITNYADIQSISESLVRFLWWTYTSGYEYVEKDIACGYRTTNKGGKGAMDCWIIEENLHWEKMCIN